jgi:hypothetical protein
MMPTIHDALSRLGYKPTGSKPVTYTLSDKQITAMELRGGRLVLLHLLRWVLAVKSQ